MSNCVDDHSAISQAATDDQYEFGVLLIQHYSLLCERIDERLPVRLRTIVEPNDVAQQVVVKAVQAAASLKSIRAEVFREWLLRIAEREVLDVIAHHDRAKRGRGFRRLPAHLSSTGSRGPLDRLADSSATPSRMAQRKEIADAIQRALVSLPTPQRNAVRLHYLEGQTVDEISVASVNSPGAVRGMLKRARLKLRHVLGSSSHWFSSRHNKYRNK